MTKSLIDKAEGLKKDAKEAERLGNFQTAAHRFSEEANVRTAAHDPVGASIAKQAAKNCLQKNRGNQA